MLLTVVAEARGADPVVEVVTLGSEDLQMKINRNSTRLYQ